MIKILLIFKNVEVRPNASVRLFQTPGTKNLFLYLLVVSELLPTYSKNSTKFVHFAIRMGILTYADFGSL